MRLRGLDFAAIILLVIGGVNWLLIGLFDFNLVVAIFGAMPWLVRLIYVVVGAAAIYAIVRSPHLAHYDRTVDRPYTPPHTPTYGEV